VSYDGSVTATSVDNRSTDLRAEIVGAGVVFVIIATTVVVLHGPVVSMVLTGDTYQWVQHAHEASHRPLLLFSDLDNFYRPSATWKLVIDRMLWGGFNAAGYRTGSLFLHGLAAFLLWIASRRLGLGWFSSVAVALLWVTSPFTDESVFVVACSHQPLLLVPWLGLIAIWPRSDESWSVPRVLTAAVMVVAAAAAKETWVVTPALVAALEFERSRSLRGIVVPTTIAGVAVAVYLLLYSMAFQGSKPYLEPGPHVFAKIPAQLAAYFYLEEPLTNAIPLTWMGLLAAAVTAVILVTCLRWRVPGSLVAVVLLLAPTIPTLLVPYMPQRYLAIPYAGFLLLIAAWVNAISVKFDSRRKLIRVVSVLVVVLVMAMGSVTVRADLEDYRSIAAAHAVLLEEAGRVTASVAIGEPVLVVRDERTTPLLDVVESPVGLPKLVFIRNFDPYGLIDTAALFEWVLADEGTRVEHITNWAETCDGVPGRILVHRDGGFVDLGPTPDLGAEAERWRKSGRGLQVVRGTAVQKCRGSPNPRPNQ